MRVRIWTIIAASGAIAGLSACVQGPEAHPRATATGGPIACSSAGLIDRDGDGAITADEWNAFRDAAFTDWDINNNYRINRDEFRTCWRAGGFRNDASFEQDNWDVMFAVFDRNLDGHLNEDEFFGVDAFASFDIDQDLRITPEELTV